MRFGPWMMMGFRLLAKLKGLRGTWLDPFGRTADRRTERALVAEYEQTVERLLGGLARENHAVAVEIASLPEEIRGYGRIKEKSIAAARSKREELLRRFAGESAARRAAA
jgi:indolepyruvate ferredoxin oxidoreductase